MRTIAPLKQKNPGVHIGSCQTCMMEGFCENNSWDLAVAQLTFTCSKSAIETLKKVGNMSKLLMKTPERR